MLEQKRKKRVIWEEESESQDDFNGESNLNNFMRVWDCGRTTTNQSPIFWEWGKGWRGFLKKPRKRGSSPTKVHLDSEKPTWTDREPWLKQIESPRESYGQEEKHLTCTAYAYSPKKRLKVYWGVRKSGFQKGGIWKREGVWPSRIKPEQRRRLRGDPCAVASGEQM